jgi:hypothetical protein
MAATGTLPLVVLGYGALFPFAYAYIALLGLTSIVAASALTGIAHSYLLKLLVFIAAASLSAFYMWPALSFDPSAVQPGAFNATRLVFAQLMFLFPLSYVLLEREGLRRHWARRFEFE